MSGALSEDANAVDQWQARLQPWLDALREAGLQFRIHSWTTVSDIDNLWVALRVRASVENSDDAWRLRVEAMELLDLLARIDKQLVWDLLLMRTSRSCDTWIRAKYKEIPVLPRFQLIVDDYNGDVTFTRLSQITLPPTSHSPAYSDVKNTLLAKWQETHRGQAFDRKNEGHVEVTLEFGLPCMEELAPRAVEEICTKIERLVRSLSETLTTTDPVAQSSPLTFNSIEFCSGSVPLSDTMLAFIGRLSSTGMPVTRVDLREVDTTVLDATIWNDFLKHQVTSRQGNGIQKLSFEMNEVEDNGMETLCLSMAHSRSLREVNCGSWSSNEDGPYVNNSPAWLWLAWALFSKEADHEIHTVSFNMELLEDMSCVDAMVAVFSHDDPLAYLYKHLEVNEDDEDDEYEDIDARSTASAAVLKPSAVAYRGFYDAVEQTHEPVGVKPGVAYRVVRNRPQDDSIEFVLPTGGTCWTNRSEILELKPVATRETHSVRHLVLHNVTFDGNPRAVIAFLELVGEPIEHLTLDGLRLGGSQSDEFFDSIFAHLPKLKRLDLVTCRVANLNFLHSNATELKSLYLHNVGLRDEDEDMWERRNPVSWENFMTALSDSTHPLTLSLRELHISFDRYSNDDLRFGTPESVVEMLDKNKDLRRCDLVAQRGSFASTSWFSDFLAHDGEILLRKLPLAETLAFLSAVTADTPSPSGAKKTKARSANQLARYNLNIEILGLILDLAAQAPRRTCMLF